MTFIFVSGSTSSTGLSAAAQDMFTVPVVRFGSGELGDGDEPAGTISVFKCANHIFLDAELMLLNRLQPPVASRVVTLNTLYRVDPFQFRSAEPMVHETSDTLILKVLEHTRIIHDGVTFLSSAEGKSFIRILSDPLRK